MLDTGASKHLCANKELFQNPEDDADGECVYMGNTTTVGVLDKREGFPQAHLWKNCE